MDETPGVELLTARQVAELLSVDEKTVYSYERRQLLAVAREERRGMVRRIFFDRPTVEAFAREHGIAVAG